MKRIIKWHENKVTGELAKGCKLCALGAKVVIYITGECNSNCFYCPLMKERKHDVIFANEQKIETVNQVIEEAKMISALGAGITGGEPVLVLERVIDYITALKKEFGNTFHCHLYTSHSLNQEQLEMLQNSGLDEIRFHPPHLNLTNKMKKSISSAKKLSFDVGIEIPVIPNKKDDLITIIEFSEKYKLDFINLNEFEITEENFPTLSQMGFHTKNDVSAAVAGSEELALEILKNYRKSSLSIHFCSSRYKDRTQLKNRLIRRAKNYSKEFDEITEEGLLVRGKITVKNKDSMLLVSELISKEYKLKPNFFEIDKDTNVIFTHWKIALEIEKTIENKKIDNIKCVEIIHQYPYKNGIITYLEPIYES